MAENDINTQNGEKTFTQDDVNRIVSERLAKEKGKADAALEEREAGLAAREKLLETREALAGTGLPGELTDALTLYGEGKIKEAVAILAKHYSNKAQRKLVGAKPAEAINKGKEDSSSEGLRKAMGLK